jgi:hypothetical protein
MLAIISISRYLSTSRQKVKQVLGQVGGERLMKMILQSQKGERKRALVVSSSSCCSRLHGSCNTNINNATWQSIRQKRTAAKSMSGLLAPAPDRSKAPRQRAVRHALPNLSLRQNRALGDISLFLAPGSAVHEDVSLVLAQRPRNSIVLPGRSSAAAPRERLAGRRVDSEREEIRRLREVDVPRFVRGEVHQGQDVEGKDAEEDKVEDILVLRCAA